MALDDLELLAGRVPDRARPVPAVHRERRWRRGGAPAPGASWTLEVFPQELQVVRPTWPTPIDVAVVWYHRDGAGHPWDVVHDASSVTAAPGDHGHIRSRPATPSHRRLPRRHLRRRPDQPHRDRVGRDPGDLRVVAPGLGFSAVAPPDWTVRPRDPGVETAVGSDAVPDALVFGRIEGERPEPTETWRTGWTRPSTSGSPTSPGRRWPRAPSPRRRGAVVPRPDGHPGARVPRGRPMGRGRRPAVHLRSLLRGRRVRDDGPGRGQRRRRSRAGLAGARLRLDHQVGVVHRGGRHGRLVRRAACRVGGRRDDVRRRPTTCSPPRSAAPAPGWRSTRRRSPRTSSPGPTRSPTWSTCGSRA